MLQKKKNLNLTLFIFKPFSDFNIYNLFGAIFQEIEKKNPFFLRKLFYFFTEFSDALKIKLFHTINLS